MSPYRIEEETFGTPRPNAFAAMPIHRRLALAFGLVILLSLQTTLMAVMGLRHMGEWTEDLATRGRAALDAGYAAEQAATLTHYAGSETARQALEESDRALSLFLEDAPPGSAIEASGKALLETLRACASATEALPAATTERLLDQATAFRAQTEEHFTDRLAEGSRLAEQTRLTVILTAIIGMIVGLLIAFMVSRVVGMAFRHAAEENQDGVPHE